MPERFYNIVHRPLLRKLTAMAWLTKSRPSGLEAMLGAKPPSSPTLVAS